MQKVKEYGTFKKEAGKTLNAPSAPTCRAPFCFGIRKCGACRRMGKFYQNNKRRELPKAGLSSFTRCKNRIKNNFPPNFWEIWRNTLLRSSVYIFLTLTHSHSLSLSVSPFLFVYPSSLCVFFLLFVKTWAGNNRKLRSSQLVGWVFPMSLLRELLPHPLMGFPNHPTDQKKKTRMRGYLLGFCVVTHQRFVSSKENA